MNKERRNRISDALTKLEELSAEITEIKNDEQEYFDRMPESFQQGEKGTQAEDDINNLEEAEEGIEQAVLSLQSF